MAWIQPHRKMKVYYQEMTYEDKTTQLLGSVYTYSRYSKALSMFEELSKASNGEYLVELEAELLDTTNNDYKYIGILGSNL